MRKKKSTVRKLKVKNKPKKPMPTDPTLLAEALFAYGERRTFGGRMKQTTAQATEAK